MVGFKRADASNERDLDSIKVCKHMIGETVFAQRFPQVLGWVEFGAVGRQEHQPHVRRHL